MRKCLRCKTVMKDGYGLSISSLFAGVANVKLSDSTNAFSSKDLDKIQVAVCPNCGEISLYIENLSKID
ncbi:MAG: hypothetical protein VB048_02655 [Bacteroidaceae bacterium]|nr:hypothetical protein [Bacteroidaceae bacterium]MEA5017162.1 hypothetical protein [Erysipelotrichaceae bacterium]